MNQAALSATRRTYRAVAALVILTVLTPMLTAMRPAQAQLFGRRPGQGMSTRTKVIALGGAALLYYLWKKHQAKQAQVGQTTTGTTVASRTPQLYRSKNGGIYYRDPNTKQAVWLTVPSQPVQVPASEVARYAPDYSRYRGAAPSAPRGYRTENFSDFDSDVMNGSDGSAYPSGPRRM